MIYGKGFVRRLMRALTGVGVTVLRPELLATALWVSLLSCRIVSTRGLRGHFGVTHIASNGTWEDRAAFCVSDVS